MQDFRIQITSHPDETECVAEIWHGTVQVAMLSFGQSYELQISIYGSEDGLAPKFSVDRYMRALADAGRQLVEGRLPRTDTSQYECLLMLFLGGLMHLEDYKRSFWQTFQADSRIRPVATYEVLNRLFTDIDVFNPDPDGRLEYEIGLEEFIASAKEGLRELRALRECDLPLTP